MVRFAKIYGIILAMTALDIIFVLVLVVIYSAVLFSPAHNAPKEQAHGQQQKKEDEAA